MFEKTATDVAITDKEKMVDLPAVTAHPQEAPAPKISTQTLLQTVSSMAQQPNIDVERVEHFLLLAERLQMREYESEFYVSLGRVQAGMKRISTDSSNPQTRSQYASYAAIDRVLRPLYSAEGFSITFDTEEAPHAECVRITARLSRGYFSHSYHVDMPADGKGAKGGDVMTKTHAFGSAMRYGMRYLVTMIFDIVIDKDDDGNAAGATGKPAVKMPQPKVSPIPITENQARDLEILLQDRGVNVSKFLIAIQSVVGFIPVTLENIPTVAYDTVVKIVLKKPVKEK